MSAKRVYRPKLIARVYIELERVPEIDNPGRKEISDATIKRIDEALGWLRNRGIQADLLFEIEDTSF